MLLGDSWKYAHVSKCLFSGRSSRIPVEGQGKFIQVEGEYAVKLGDESLSFSPSPTRCEQESVGDGLLRSGSPGPFARVKHLLLWMATGYLLFRRDRPAKRGNSPPLVPFALTIFCPGNIWIRYQTQRLARHVAVLTSPDLAGRFPGNNRIPEGAGISARQLEEMGSRPIHQPFSITVKDIGRSDLLLRTSGRRRKLKAIPLRFSKEGEWKGLLPVGRHKRADELRGLPEKISSPFPIRTFPERCLCFPVEKIRTSQSKKPSP